MTGGPALASPPALPLCHCLLETKGIQTSCTVGVPSWGTSPLTGVSHGTGQACLEWPMGAGPKVGRGRGQKA